MPPPGASLTQRINQVVSYQGAYQLLHNQLGGIGYDNVYRFVKEGRGPTDFTPCHPKTRYHYAGVPGGKTGTTFDSSIKKLKFCLLKNTFL